MAHICREMQSDAIATARVPVKSLSEPQRGSLRFGFVPARAISAGEPMTAVSATAGEAS